MAVRYLPASILGSLHGYRRDVLRHLGGLGRTAVAVVILLTLGLGLGIVVGAAGRRAAARRPTATQIEGVMWHTILAREPGEHFYPAGQLTTTSDGMGGNLTAEVGTSLPSTDGNGQLVFFWHNSRFVGWDSSIDSMLVLQVQSLAPRSFQITYENYAPNDPACCPSLIPVSVAYRWSGRRFVAQAPLPMVSPVPGRVRLIR
jgi:LppP/LprE lipoprotein